MKMNDMILISVDDHVVEPPDAFVRHTPARYKGRFPGIIKGINGEDIWRVEDTLIPNIALNAVAGRRPEEYGFEPTGYSQLRKGTYDVDARVDDMNADGVLAGLNFPSFPGMAGQNLLRLKDKELALAIVRAWNDWHIDEWCGKHPGRFIPLAILPIWDQEGAAEEVRRVAKKGCLVISFPTNPAHSGLPSIQQAAWDPVWRACSDEKMNVCMHIADASGAIPSADSPVDVFITNLPVSLYATAADLTFSPVLRKYPDLKFSLSEGGIGWIPHFTERMDFVHSHHGWTNQDFGGKKPSEVFREHVYVCFINDPHGLRQRHEVGLDLITWENDYPHSDSCWPRSPEVLWETLKDIPAADVNKITFENAMRAYHFDPFKHIAKADCTVGALRARATAVDLSYIDSRGQGTPPAKHAGVITFADVAAQLAKVHEPATHVELA